MSIKETEDIYRLYVREWVIMHTITMSGSDAKACLTQAVGWVRENLHGRVHDKDTQVQANTDNVALFWCHVMVFKDNLKGEFKHHADAERYATWNKLDEYTIVVRNSKHDHAIRGYGVKKL